MTRGRLLTAAVAAAGLGSGFLALGPADAPARWAPGVPIAVWIEKERVPADYVDMVRRAIRTWEQASKGAVRFDEVREFPKGGVRLRFVTGDSSYGEAAPSVDRDGRIVRAEVVLSIDMPGDVLQKQLVLYLTALHELGHALGLAHTDDFDAIMYRFRKPADPERYFLRYRRLLRSADDIGSKKATGLFPTDLRELQRLYGR